MQQEPKQSELKSRIFGVAGTVVVHSLLFLFFFTVVTKTKIPPFPEGGGGPGMGIEVNLGYSDEGMGGFREEIAVPAFKEAVKPAAVHEASQQPSPTTEKTDDKYLTQETEESVPMNAGKANPSDDKKDNRQVVNPALLYKGRKPQEGSGANEGISGKPGNQGQPNGSLYSKNYNGTGGEGSGGGTGGGTGKGIGNGTGDGISFDLIGRKSKELVKPPPPRGLRDVVYVVVRITVNQKGLVTGATPGAPGTTTTDQTLWKLAQDAAFKAKFDAKPAAPVEQKGMIKYKFVPH